MIHMDNDYAPLKVDSEGRIAVVDSVNHSTETTRRKLTQSEAMWDIIHSRQMVWDYIHSRDNIVKKIFRFIFGLY